MTVWIGAQRAQLAPRGAARDRAQAHGAIVADLDDGACLVDDGQHALLRAAVPEVLDGHWSSQTTLS